jgi:hypothetical protein
MASSRPHGIYGAPSPGTQVGVLGSSSQGYFGSFCHMTDQSAGGLIYMQARYNGPSYGGLLLTIKMGAGRVDAFRLVMTLCGSSGLV